MKTRYRNTSEIDERIDHYHAFAALTAKEITRMDSEFNALKFSEDSWKAEALNRQFEKLIRRTKYIALRLEALKELRAELQTPLLPSMEGDGSVPVA